ncbi:MAG: UDP-N-acetylmuramoyl-tripeptide--D-alanyl-D-alanine ligase [Gammaproteobacteria bacterium]
MKPSRVVDRVRALQHWVEQRSSILCAPLYRRVLSRTRFIGITGSGGKTTTKDLSFEVLRSKFRVHKSVGSKNTFDAVARGLFGIRPGAAYHVQEVGAKAPGSLDRTVKLLAPSIAVVTNIRSDHITSYKTEDEVAREKSKLVKALSPDGIAILNADDERVIAMSALAPGAVITFGLSPTADVRADQVVSEWPGGLRFVVSHRGQSFAGSSALHGTHFIHCVLAAVAVGIATGISVPEALQAMRELGPRTGRMSVYSSRRGVTFIRDEWKSPLWSIRAPIDFLRTVPSRRKVLVLGTISDYRGSSYPSYRETVEYALGAADEVIMVGEHAGKAPRIAKQLGSDAVRGFSTVEAAARYLLDTAASGDVVLIKGAGAQHLTRVALAFDRDVRCWLAKCGRVSFCDECSLVSIPAAD